MREDDPDSISRSKELGSLFRDVFDDLYRYESGRADVSSVWKLEY